jgi:hypothetical protein
MVQVAAKTPRLTTKQITFAHFVLAGDALTTAYRKAYNCTKASPKVLSVRGSELRYHPDVDAYITAALAKREEKALLTRNKKREVLATIALNKRAKPSDRIQAIKADNDMTGDSVIRVEEEITLSLILQRVQQATPAHMALNPEEMSLLRSQSTKALEAPIDIAPAVQEAPKAKERAMGPFEADVASYEPIPAPRAQRERTYTE